MNPRTYLSWVSTAKLVTNIGKEIGDYNFENVPGLVFDDLSFIEIKIMFDKPSTFNCVTGREEIESANLFEVIDFLWYTHSVSEWPNG